MIGYLEGKVLEKRAPWLTLLVQGVGYEIEAPMTVFYQLPEAGEAHALYTHFVVRDDANLLYGFSSRYERELFRALIKVTGVGPKLALAILSGMEAERLVLAIQSQDLAALTRIPGIGRKTAERLVIDMSDRLGKLEGAPEFGSPVVAQVAAPPTARDDAIAALESLGYKPKDAQLAISRVADAEGLSSESLIRAALKQLAK